MNTMPKVCDSNLIIAGQRVGSRHPTYFIADIAANHDSDLERAKALIWMAKEAGADAAKFQHFKAATIVSDYGFRSIGSQQAHQSSWNKSVYEVYQDASVDIGWTSTLKETCDKAGIAFFTSPYAVELVDAVDPFVPAYKIGSGDITWLEIVRHIASKGKPYILATGASTMDEVDRAVQGALQVNPQLALLQCNTNYTGRLENFRYIQLNVLRSYRAMYPEMVLGLSDHTPGHACVLGAVSLGARIIEKHFTDDCTRVGPDHKFSMDPAAWREMVDRTRELEFALGNGVKRVEENELETVIVQRRSLRTTSELAAGHRMRHQDLIALRPCPRDAVSPADIDQIIGLTLRRSKQKGEHLTHFDFE
ncbi:N-acetylneuraminate synthase family protein [Synechococcus sp. EJ6-Ellesmere]|uniref:N-acetylneuraminate synthase family protein n=1 Tax=Synechococcus sp. EJ6-Ellesmere TaxID=2823734 RepID=UPI0020CD6BAB|nr:N-acetylneuraminate synthase family protein [Synechococcus sp. EJ6-Ellesmere]